MVLEGAIGFMGGGAKLSSVVLFTADPVCDTTNQPGNTLTVIVACLL